MGPLQLEAPEQQSECWASTGALAPPAASKAIDGGQPMSASEQMYYYGAPLGHVVQYEERLRNARCHKTIRELIRHRPVRRAAMGPASLPTLQTFFGQAVVDEA